MYKNTFYDQIYSYSDGEETQENTTLVPKVAYDYDEYGESTTSDYSNNMLPMGYNGTKGKSSYSAAFMQKNSRTSKNIATS